MRTLNLALALGIVLAACSGDRSGEAPAEQAVRQALQETVHETRDPRARPGVPDSALIGSCGAPVIDGDGIGDIRIGMPVDAIIARCAVVRDTTDLDGEGHPERIVVVSFGRDTVNVEVDSGRVWRIEVTRPGPTTADSFGVGTPLARLLTLPSVSGLTGEGGLFLVSRDRCGLSFELSPVRAPAGVWPVARLRALPESTVARRVLIVGCGDA